MSFWEACGKTRTGCLISRPSAERLPNSLIKEDTVNLIRVSLECSLIKERTLNLIRVSIRVYGMFLH